MNFYLFVIDLYLQLLHAIFYKKKKSLNLKKDKKIYPLIGG